MSTPLQQLAEHDQSVWIDFLSRRFVKDGDLKGLVEQGVVGVTSNPTIFQGAIAEGDAYDDQIRELSAELRRSQGDLLAARQGRHPRRLRHPAPRLGRGQGQGRLGLARGRPEPRARHRGHQVRGRCACTSSSTARTSFIKIPATVEGLQAIEDTIADGIPVNVTLIFSLERHRKVAEAYVARRPALRRRRRRPERQARLRRLVLRLARGHRGRQAPRRARRPRRAQGQARDRQRQARLPDLPGGLLGPGVGGAGGQGRDQAALPVGVDRRSRTRPTRTRSTSRSSSGPTRSTRCRASSSRPSTTTARSAATRCSRTSRRRSRILDAVRGRRRLLRRRRRRRSRSEGVEKFAKSFADLIEGLETKLKTLVAA